MSMLREPTTVGIRDLKQNASAVVARAAAGEILTITDRGRPVARLLPLERKSLLQQMVEGGQIKLPERPLTDAISHRAVENQADGPTLTQILLQMRDEERY